MTYFDLPIVTWDRKVGNIDREICKIERDFISLILGKEDGGL